MGIGLHGGGVAMIEWLVGQGAKVIATDKKSKQELDPSIQKISKLKNVTIVTGQHRMEDFTGVDMVIKNPMVRWKNKYIQAALKNGVKVEMDSSLFFRLCKSRNIIGITGTKGKTTTSMLIAEMLKNEGLEVVSVGIGQLPVVTRLKKITAETRVVFEMSSWRCSALAKIKKSPHIALVTNFYQDHLNYYNSMEEYLEDKKQIFLHQKKDDFLILNADSELVASLENEAKGKKVFFSLSPNSKENNVFVKEGRIQVRDEKGTWEVLPTSKVALKGSHNLYNACAMCAVGLVLGVSPETMKKTLLEFDKVPHRLENVGVVDGVKFINDTTATTPEAGIAGVNAFTEKLHLICGGSNKKLKLDAFAKKIAKNDNIKNVYLLKGEASEELAKKIAENEGSSKIIETFESMKEAVFAAKEKAQEGEVVLLSPGCASFGMFANEFDRGNKFKEAFEEVKA